MSVFIDRKFLLFVAPKLERFAQKKQDLYNFRCPYCGDSQKNKTKARGFIFRKKNDYFFMCHNCGASHTFYNFLNHVDPTLVKDYSFERYKNEATHHGNAPKPELTEYKNTPVFRESINLPSIQELPTNHYAKEYILNRKIPEKFLSQLYYAEDFKSFVESLNIEKEDLKENDPRIVIPFYDENKKLIAFQGRALGNSKARYITISVEETPKFFGLDRVDWTKKVYVLEGPFDSMFIENAVATADSDLSRIGLKNCKNAVLVYDNEPRNREIVRHIGDAIDLGFKVCLLPDTTKEKDINDQVKSGIAPGEIKKRIDKFTYSGLEAKIKFLEWKKV